MTTKKGVWNLQQVRDKQLQSLWEYYDLYAQGNGELWVAGLNNQGQLGQNEQGGEPSYGTSRSSPVQIPGTTWSKVLRGGNSHSGAINASGQMWVWGYNNNGQLGQNEGGSPSNDKYSSPVQIPGTWTSGATDMTATLAVNTSGELWATGMNEYGQLGQGNTTQYSSPVQIPGTTWDDVIAGNGSVAATKTDGTLWAWGYNHRGQLGVNDRTNYSSPKQIPGTTWTLSNNASNQIQSNRVIKTDGTLWSWGYNGALGLNDTVKYSSPVQIPGTTWRNIGGDISNAIATKTDGTLWVWGNNTKGALGQNQAESVSVSSPIQVGSGTDWAGGVFPDYKYALAAKVDGTLWSWGYNNFGQLGHNNRTWYSSPTQIPGGWSSKINGINGGNKTINIIKPIAS